MLNIQSLKIINPAFFAEKKVKVKKVSTTKNPKKPSDNALNKFLSFLTFDGLVGRSEMEKLTGFSINTISDIGTYLKSVGKIRKVHEKKCGNEFVFFQKVKG